MSIDFDYVSDLASQLSEIPPDSIISRTFYSGQDAKAILFGFAPGQELSEHTSTKSATLHFLEGEAQLTMGDQVYDAVPGTWAHMQPHIPHSILAKTQVTMLLFMYS